MKNRHAGTHTQHNPAELLTELRALVAEAEAMVSHSPDEAPEETIGPLRARYEAMQERLSELYNDTKRRITSGIKYTDTAIRENPYQAIAIAAVFGLIVGVLLGRRGNK